MPRRAADAALEAGCTSVVIVLGAAAEQIALTLEGIPTVLNPEWAEGLGSSIRVGIESVEIAAAEVDAVLLLAADQPGVTSGDLRRLIDAVAVSGAAAARYDNTIGVPACLSRQHFLALKTLPPGAGAKPLLRSIAGLIPIDMPAAATDVDTPEDATRQGAG